MEFMYKYRIKFLALDDTIEFEIKSDAIEIIEQFVDDLLIIFRNKDKYGNNKSTISSLQINTPNINKSIIDFVSKYNEKQPKLNTITAFFRKLKSKEHFFFLPNTDVEQALSIKMRNYLKSLETDVNFEELNGQTDELFGKLMAKYHMGIIGDNRILIGERDKTKRICRFCNNQRENLSFNNKAHAISEALGNKTAVLLDECDVCNKLFSETIEPDIILYLSFLRTFFNVKGKAGIKKFKGNNFELENNEIVKLSFYGNENRASENEIPNSVQLETQPMVAQNIYKSLCKYFLSVIDEKYLQHFQKTIDWINGEIKIDNLPKIGERTTYDFFSLQPKIGYFIRKDKESEIPFAVGEFHFTCKVFAFIIPLTDQDEKDFLDVDDYKKYWKTFKHFNKSKGWIFHDYSDNDKKNFKINLNFEVKNK